MERKIKEIRRGKQHKNVCVPYALFPLIHILSLENATQDFRLEPHEHYHREEGRVFCQELFAVT